jgi:hypothetical protein
MAGEPLVLLGAIENGGALGINKKTGEAVVGLVADEYGNGVVGAYNRKGKGRYIS